MRSSSALRKKQNLKKQLKRSNVSLEAAASAKTKVGCTLIRENFFGKVSILTSMDWLGPRKLILNQFDKICTKNEPNRAILALELLP